MCVNSVRVCVALCKFRVYPLTQLMFSVVLLSKKTVFLCVMIISASTSIRRALDLYVHFHRYTENHLCSLVYLHNKTLG